MSAKTYIGACRKGHMLRYVSNGRCVECTKNQPQSLNRDERRQYMKRYREIRKRLGNPAD